MAPYFPPPHRDSLLLPLLACLPIAFVSSIPPPALPPLLSPILRQRVKLLSETGSADSSWLSLLCWESSEAAELPSIVESVTFEPHPVSGEIEIGEVDRIQYRRLDEETLQSILRLSDIGLSVICLWCEGDQEGGADGWRIAELKPLQDPSRDCSKPWYNTVSEADQRYKIDAVDFLRRTDSAVDLGTPGQNKAQAEEDNDDDYWAQYDQTASETSAQRLTPALQDLQATAKTEPSEADYYARYADVQPVMDHDDPSADREMMGRSSLHGDTLVQAAPPSTHQTIDHTSGNHAAIEVGSATENNIIHTRPSSSSSAAVVQLEQSAQNQSQAEIAIQQHISTTMKSLYRLTRGAGIEKSEFERLIHNELDTLGMMDDD